METASMIQRRPNLEQTKSLIGKLDGSIIFQNDRNYDEARRAWNLYYQHRPNEPCPDRCK